MPDERLALVKHVITSWANGDLTDNQAMMNITIIMGIRKPSSPECKNWAEGVILNGS
jgi:hypothetical protein